MSMRVPLHGAGPLHFERPDFAYSRECSGTSAGAAGLGFDFGAVYEDL